MNSYNNAFLNDLGDPGSVISLFNSLPEILFFIKDADSRIMGCNLNFAERSGYAHPSEMIGKTTQETSPPELAQGYVEADRNVIESGKPSYDILELNQTYDGSVNWFMTTKIPLHDKSGQIVGLAGIARDIKKSRVELEHFQRFQDVFDFIETNIRKRIEIPILAHMVNASVSKFERDFKKNFRTTPSKYIIQYRIKVACRQLVETDQSIADIAFDCGFYDQSAMTRFFKQHMNRTPSAYRKSRSMSK